jgi:hypothetical protein
MSYWHTKTHVSRLILLAGLFLLIPHSSRAQDTTKAPVYGWTHGMVAGFALTQASYTNWTAGGENALAYTASVDGKSIDDQERISWATTYKFAFGQARLGNKDLRKTEDKIDFETVLNYKMSEHWTPYAAATLKTQFAKGFTYDEFDNATAVSSFFDPGYLTQTAGIQYQPGPIFKTRFGVGLREVFTSDFPVYSDDPDTTPELENSLVEGIVESVSNLDWPIAENILFTSKLELLAPFETMDQITVRNDNTLAAKVSTYLTAKVNVELLNDWRVSRKTQVRETIAFGLSYVVL